ncbi:hypothetical protein TWF481_000472 [Arthrobotrys musiformis]|uniref:Ecp2 effector protein domain-containing protein n=1 Tax=Arthrobotrys musiformis TaxID=47236 RepID=A0AAV9WPN9_9PEZI
MRSSFLIPSFLVLVAPVLSSTTYGCWSDKSQKFHKDCMIAASGIVLQQTGTDDNSWVPPYIITQSWGSCTAKLRGSGSGNVVPAIALISSFEQLGSKCQNGYFYYDSGYINAELNGKSGWKRDAPTEIELETTWNTTESIPHYESKEPEWLSSRYKGGKSKEEPEPSAARSRLAKRANGKYISSLTGRAGTFQLYRGTQTIIGNHPGADVLVVDMYNVVLDLVDGALTNTGTYLLRSGIDVTSGSTVNVLAIAIQLGGQYSSWQQMFNSFGDGGDLARALINSAVVNWDGEQLTAGVYHIYNRFNDVVFSLILNGVTGSTGNLP